MNNQLCAYLVRDGIITEQQRDEALRLQEKRTRPIGAILEDHFGIDPKKIERAWAEQYERVGEHADDGSIEPEDDVIDLVSARQAWQFGIVPVRYEHGRLVACSSRNHLPRAIRFATQKLRAECDILLATESELGRALHQHYPMPGLGPDENGAANLQYDFDENVIPIVDANRDSGSQPAEE